MTILIVDDDVALARSLKRFLESRGHGTLLAHNVDSALRTLASAQPDFVLTDFDLGEFCNGADLACWARNAFRVPAAIMTAHDPRRIQRELLELGLRDVEILAKPFGLEDLMGHLAPFDGLGPWAAARAPRAS
jgi:DNA-binding response OmpR family regulator